MRWTVREMLQAVEEHAYTYAARGDTRSPWTLIGDVAEMRGFSDALDALSAASRAKFPAAVARGRQERDRDQRIVRRRT